MEFRCKDFCKAFSGGSSGHNSPCISGTESFCLRLQVGDELATDRLTKVHINPDFKNRMGGAKCINMFQSTVSRFEGIHKLVFVHGEGVFVQIP